MFENKKFLLLVEQVLLEMQYVNTLIKINVVKFMLQLLI